MKFRLIFLLPCLLFAACGGGSGPVGEQITNPEELREKLIGFWEMQSWDGEAPTKLQLTGVWVSFKADGTWEWVSRLSDEVVADQKVYGGGGNWNLERNNHLMLMNGDNLRESDIRVEKDTLWFDRDPAILKDGLMPGPSRYIRSVIPDKPAPAASTNQPPAKAAP